MSKKNATKAKAAAKSDPDRVPLTQAMKKTVAIKPKMNVKRRKAAVGEGKPKKLSCLSAAAQVLKSEAKPLNCKGMIDLMFSRKLWHSDAPTPAATLYSAILREVTNKKDKARFKKIDRGLFIFNG